MQACKQSKSSVVDVDFVELTQEETELRELRRKCRLYEIACAEQYEELVRMQDIAFDLEKQLSALKKDALLKVST